LHKKIFIRHEYGQLGNVLFRLANALGYALEHDLGVEDYTLAFCNYHDGSSNIRFFENYHSFHFFEYPYPRSRLINRVKWKLRKNGLQSSKLIENFDPNYNLQNLKPNRSYELKGFHFSSGDLVLKHRAKICEILRFRESEIIPVDNLIKDARKNYKVILGVHIRQNDYKTFYNGKYFVSSDQYVTLINHFKSLIPNGESVGIVICSDDVKLLIKMQKEYPDYIYPRGNVAQDMSILSKCDYIMGPKATTMSAWTAFIANASFLQVSRESENFDLCHFKKISKLESFNPFLN
jgi:hypothetical protein